MSDIVYTTKTGIITQMGEQRTEFPGGKPVTVKTYDGKEVQGVNLSVKFDFDDTNWYTGNFQTKDVERFLAKGKSVEVKTWAKEATNGKIYHNFAIVFPKKPDTLELETKVNALISTIARQGNQIMSLHTELEAVKRAINPMSATGTTELSNTPPAVLYDESEAYPEDINPDDIPF